MIGMDSNHPYCLITGASRGLGSALAKSFWANGWSLILVGRSQADLQGVVEAMGERPGQKAHVFEQDLSAPDAAVNIVGAAKQVTPTLDALINNAAIQGAVGSLWINDWSEWEATIRVDLLAPVALCKEVIPWMMETGKGSVINLSGGGATGPRPHFTAYATAKAGLVRFSETVAEELKPHNVRVNCVAPGAMGTAMLKEVLAKGEQVVGQREYAIALAALSEGGADMRNVADLCLFLASDRSAGITGKLISAVWDDWECWPKHIDQLATSDVYTLRRIAGRDRGLVWGDK